MDKLKINSQVMIMRKIVKKAKIHFINKFTKEIRLLEKKIKNQRCTEQKLAKLKRKKERVISEVKILKQTKPDSISRMVLGKTKDWGGILKMKNPPLEDRCQALLAMYEPIQRESNKFYSDNSNFADRIVTLIDEWEEKNKRSRAKLEHKKTLENNESGNNKNEPLNNSINSIKSHELEMNCASSEKSETTVNQSVEHSQLIAPNNEHENNLELRLNEPRSDSQNELNVKISKFSPKVSKVAPLEVKRMTCVQFPSEIENNDRSEGFFVSNSKKDDLCNTSKKENESDSEMEVDKQAKKVMPVVGKTKTQGKQEIGKRNKTLLSSGMLEGNSDSESEMEAESDAIVGRLQGVVHSFTNDKSGFESGSYNSSESESKVKAENLKQTAELSLKAKLAADKPKSSPQKTMILPSALNQSTASPTQPPKPKRELARPCKPKPAEASQSDSTGIAAKLAAIADLNKCPIVIRTAKPKDKAIKVLNLDELEDVDEIPIQSSDASDESEEESCQRKKDPFFIRDGEDLSDDEDKNESPPVIQRTLPGSGERLAKSSLDKDSQFRKGDVKVDRNYRNNMDRGFRSGNKFADRDFKKHDRGFEGSRNKRFKGSTDKDFHQRTGKGFIQNKPEPPHFGKNAKQAQVCDNKPLHPSWEAKRKMQEAANSKFQGKRIVFDT